LANISHSANRNFIEACMLTSSKVNPKRGDSAKPVISGKMLKSNLNGCFFIAD